MRVDLSWVFGILFPSRCVGCGLRGVDLCEPCLGTIQSLEPASCPRCGRPSRLGAVCGPCHRYQGALAGIRAASIYQGTVRKAIYYLKYRHRRTLASPLARLMELELRRKPLQLDLLTPVPLHPTRLTYRGYNQSELLARELGERLEIRVGDCLERARGTATQAGLNASARKANVHGAFLCVKGAGVTGLRIGVVDDVCTTGATLEDCARALKEAGCISVWGVAVARDLLGSSHDFT